MTDRKSAIQDVHYILNTIGNKMKDMSEAEIMKLIDQEIKILRKRNDNGSIR